MSNIAVDDPRLRLGDCQTYLAELTPGTVPLIVVDPPYNIGENYDEYDDNRPVEEYLAWCRGWLAQCYQVLSATGTFWLVIGDRYVSELDVLCKALGFKKRSQVVWHYCFGVNSTRKLTPSHAQLLYYTKHAQNFTFNADSVKVPSARQRVYGDKRAKAGGRLPDDTWVLSPRHMPDSFCSGEDTWSISRVCGTFKERVGTPNQLPEALVARIIRLCSNPAQTVPVTADIHEIICKEVAAGQYLQV